MVREFWKSRTPSTSSFGRMDQITNQMKKERHIKTFPEKYGTRNLMDEVDKYIAENFKKYDSTRKLFEALPYIGYLRIDTNNSDFNYWWCETEDDWIQAKVVWVDVTQVCFYYYDSHHHMIALEIEDYYGFAVQGNVLIKLGDL